MFLTNLELHNFRNYDALELELSPRVNIFFGQNAQGKTNLLESVSLLCFGRSFRTRKEIELIQWGNDTTYLCGIFKGADFPTKIELGISNKEKRIKIDGQVTKNNALFGKVPVVNFSPDDLLLIKGGPQYRRDFIDLYLALIEPKYRFVYYNFYKVLQQRNQLFKSGRMNHQELETWDEQLVEKGSKVIQYRIQLLNSVKQFITEAQYRISEGSENLRLEYLCFNEIFTNDDLDYIKGRFYEEINKKKNSEIERRITLVGPHHDDLRLSFGNGVDLKNYGSQGQQRTASLALKIGLVEKIKDSRGEYPILLLDDVMSEFDDIRKRALLSVLMSSVQTFMTSTSRRDFPTNHPESVFFNVFQGGVTRVD